MESALYSLFKVNTKSLVRNKIEIAKTYHIQPSEIDRLVFFEYEWYLNEIEDIVNKENKAQKEEEEKYGNIMPSNITMPAMPDMSNIGNIGNMPDISMPSGF